MIHHYLLTTADAAKWRAVLPANVVVTGSLGYARIWEKQMGCPARLFVAECAGSVVAYPFFLRPVHSLPFAADCSEAAWDTFTPDYTGPLGLGASPCQGPYNSRFTELFGFYCPGEPHRGRVRPPEPVERVLGLSRPDPVWRSTARSSMWT